MPVSKPFAAPPDVIRWQQRSQGNGDCVVAAIALATGSTYEQALEAAVRECPRKIMACGMFIKETRRTLRAMGFQTKLRFKFDVDEDTGILFVDQPQYGEPGTQEHAVYLWEGRILEPQHARQQLWLSAGAFLAHYKTKATHLLEVFKED